MLKIQSFSVWKFEIIFPYFDRSVDIAMNL